MTEQKPKFEIDYKRVALFLVIAITVSNVFRFDIFAIYPFIKDYSKLLYIISVSVLEGAGIFGAAILAIYLLKKQRKTEITFFGTSKTKAIVMAVIPVVLLTFFGVNNSLGFDANTYGFIAGFWTLIYCILEEYGWRGYLEEEFKGIKTVVRILIIGSIWYFWHLSFFTAATVGQNLFFLGMLIFGSWGIGKVAEITKSILASACFHLIVNLFMYNEFFRDGIENQQKMIVIFGSVSVWIVILTKWNTNNKKEIV